MLNTTIKLHKPVSAFSLGYVLTIYFLQTSAQI